MPGYYDYMLGFIPVSLLSITAVLTFGGVSSLVAIPIAGTVAIGAICHGMFVNAPIDSANRQASPPAASSASRQPSASGSQTTNTPAPNAD